MTEETKSYLDLLKFHDPFKFPEAEGLIPINPKKWAAFSAGSVLGQNLENADSFTGKPIDNLKTAKLYLETSTDTQQFCRRLGEVVLDTTAVNLAAEIGDLVGSSAAGTYANHMGRKWRKKSSQILTALTISKRKN